MADLAEIAKRACDEAMSAGADFADVGVGRGKGLSVELERGRVKSSDAAWSSGCSVRAIVDGATGWASAPGADLDAALVAARQAVELAKAGDRDPDFRSLPPPEPGCEVEGLFDDRVEALTIDDLVDFCLANVESARSVEPRIVVAGGARCGSGYDVLVNSLGVNVVTSSTAVNTFVQAIMREGDDVGSFYDYDCARVLDDFRPDGLGAKAAKEALRYLGARKIESGTMAIVLGPLGSPSISQAICLAASAEEVQRNRSFLASKLGERIASEHVTLIDDPFIPSGMSSAAYDGEGVPHRPLTIAEKGILKSYFHNSYTAAKAGVKNTGHGTRGGIATTNVIPALGDTTAAEIIADTEVGLYISDGIALPNLVTGDLSTTVDFGFKIEGGEIVYPVKNTMLGGNIFDLLMKIDAVSSDYREEPGQIMPTIRILDVRVAGGA